MLDMTFQFRLIQQCQLLWLSCLLVNGLSAPLAIAQETPSTTSTPPAQSYWLQFQGDQRAITVETDLIRAVIVMIEEIHGKPVSVGESFSAAHVVGFFDEIEQMHEVAQKYYGFTGLEL